MDPRSKQVLDLLRLLDRSLVEVDEQALRQRIAHEPALRGRVTQLGMALDELQSEDQATVVPDEIWATAEQEAAILDRQAVTAIDEPSLPRVDRRNSTNGLDERESSARTDAVARGMWHALSQEFSRHSDASTNPASGSAHFASPTEIQIAAELPRQRIQPRRRVWLQRIATLAAVVAFTWLASKFLIRPATEPLPPLPELARESVEPTIPDDSSDSPLVPPRDVVRDDPLPPINEPPRDQLPELVDRSNERPPSAIDRIPDAEPLRPRPRPQPPQVALSPIPQPLRWQRISGIVVGLPKGSDYWEPVQVATSDNANSATDYEEVRALGNSWGEARTATGIRVVLGPQASAHIEITQHDVLTVELEVRRGKVGLSELPALTEVRLPHQHASTVWQVAQNDTSLAVDAEESSAELWLVQGTIQDYGQTFSGSLKLSLRDGDWTTAQLTNRLPWLTRPPSLTAAERQLANIALQERDVVAGLLARRTGLNDFQAQLAAQWCFDIDAVRAIPLALMSPAAGQRKTAALWLVDPAREPDELRRVLVEIQAILGASTCAVPRWIMVVRGEAPVSRTLVDNMLVGLRPTELLFVREMAVASLAQLSGQNFPAYNPQAPDRPGINQVTAATQAWRNRLP